MWQRSVPSEISRQQPSAVTTRAVVRSGTHDVRSQGSRLPASVSPNFVARHPPSLRLLDSTRVTGSKARPTSQRRQTKQCPLQTSRTTRRGYPQLGSWSLELSDYGLSESCGGSALSSIRQTLVHCALWPEPSLQNNYARSVPVQSASCLCMQSWSCLLSWRPTLVLTALVPHQRQAASAVCRFAVCCELRAPILHHRGWCAVQPRKLLAQCSCKQP